MREIIIMIVISFSLGFMGPKLGYSYDFAYHACNTINSVLHDFSACPCKAARELSQKNLKKYILDGVPSTYILEVLGQPNSIVDAPGLPDKVWCYEHLNICAWVQNGKCIKMRALHVYWH